jgi:hypothetical protein
MRHRWGDHLAVQLRDHSLEQLRAYLRKLGVELTLDDPEVVRSATAEVVARAVHGGSGRVGQASRFGTEALILRRCIVNALRASGRTGNLVDTWNLTGTGVESYRAMTNEIVVLPSGVVLSGLLWQAARWAEVILASQEIMKTIVFALGAKGKTVLAVEDEAVWVTPTVTSGAEECEVVDSHLANLLGYNALRCSVSGPSEG